jgi:cytosine/adenosine deaminase-related metal-dependent hydrolase
MATTHGARCLGRADEIGSLEAGKLADVALWGGDDLGGAGVADPVAALVLAPPPRVRHLFVNGRPVVTEGCLVSADENSIADELAGACRALAQRARVAA